MRSRLKVVNVAQDSPDVRFLPCSGSHQKSHGASLTPCASIRARQQMRLSDVPETKASGKVGAQHLFGNGISKAS